MRKKRQANIEHLLRPSPSPLSPLENLPHLPARRAQVFVTPHSGVSDCTHRAPFPPARSNVCCLSALPDCRTSGDRVCPPTSQKLYAAAASRAIQGAGRGDSGGVAERGGGVYVGDLLVEHIRNKH